MAQVQDDARIDAPDQLPSADDDYSEEYCTGETYEIEFEHPETAESNVDFDDDVEYLEEYDGGENGGNGADPSPEWGGDGLSSVASPGVLDASLRPRYDVQKTYCADEDYFPPDFTPSDPTTVPPIIDLTMCPSSDHNSCLLYTSPSPRDQRGARMPSSA